MSHERASAPPVILLMGPTAAGKTGSAVELVERFPVDIISVDSALVYRGMDIGTAKPDEETLARAPHRLIDIRAPEENYSAADFRADALREIRAIHAAGRVPLLAGGTMLYYRALFSGLSSLPSADAGVRAQIEKRAHDVGWPRLHDELKAADPEAASGIDPNDPQRIQRALEVMALTGKTVTEARRAGRREPPEFSILRLVVCPGERTELHRRIALRFDEMMAQGFETEMRGLHARPELDPSLSSMRAVGYRQGWAWLDGAYGDGDEGRRIFREKVLAATRQLAKRQLTWLRKETDALWYDSSLRNALGGIHGDVRKFLENGQDRSQLIHGAGQ
ncbi:tRNA (adenosine(37)-N6)-dimethylallyltransferase MiaA [Marinihelvus fidelis]|uniref:tRNA dimethylallyltransferase n=1 Tax=Marinihelvus fidelis TaxID=2613842 RepID=A0A5N0TEL4_9GAMM|nr:tRNA (adenosine(37)-N6)-dimethylallyltransferase MiaA [Marinihelvus fidelis]KAA9133111.1 tRNA (adenosine(37)-N6)-dimethylallyltransferase MiaA [Marinihelvus fidelis]